MVKQFSLHAHCAVWFLALHDVCGGFTNLTLCSARLCDRQMEREHKKRWVEERKQLFVAKEQTVELVDQGETCFHWLGPIHTEQ